MNITIDMDKRCAECQKQYQSGEQNPDYCADPRLVIEAMPFEFIEEVFSIDEAEYHSYRPEKRIIVFAKFVDLIMDKTGKLAKLALEFIEREVKNDQPRTDYEVIE